MKIEKLIIQNLNSIEDAEIVFSEGVLAQEPLFLICGATGTGKTTILDAITLALYDKVSRYEKVKNKEKTENGITTKDAFNVLRKGKYDGKAELHFSVNDTHYIATWSVHKTKSNTYTNNNRRKLEVVDGELRTVILDKIGAVNKKIEELVGLTYEQFIRSVMLAQGEFNTFLVSEKTEQSEILEMLTGTEVYSQIAEAIKLKKADALQRKKEIEALYNSLKDNILSDEEVTTLENQKLELEKDDSESHAFLKQMELYLNWIKKNKDLNEEYNNVKLQYDSVIDKINSPEYKENKSLVDDYFFTSKIREKLNELQRDESEVNKIERQFVDDESHISALKFSLQNEKNRKSESENLKIETSNWIDYHRCDELMYQNVNLIVGLLNEMSMILNHKKKKELELVQNEAKKAELSNQLREYYETIDNVKKDITEADNILDELMKGFNSEEQNRLLIEYQNVNAKKQNTQDRVSQLNAVRTVLEQYLELEQNIKNEKIIYENLKLSYNDKNAALNEAKANFDRNDAEFQKQRNMVEGWAKTMRSKLNEGEPCPVCGSREHFYNDENIVDSLFVSLENEWKRLGEIYRNTQNELNKIESELAVVNRNIVSDENRLQMLLKELNRLCNDNPVFELERIDLTIGKHNESILKYDNEIEAINLKLNEMASIKNKIEEAQKNKRVIEEKLNSVEQQMLVKQKESQEMDLQLMAIKTSISDSELKYLEKKSSVNEYIRIDDWEKSWMENMSAFSLALNESAQTWNQKLEMLRNIESQIATAETIISQSEKYFERIFELIPRWRNIDAHKSYIDEKDLIPYLSAIYEKAKERMSQRGALEKEMISLKNEIDDFVNNSSCIDIERLKMLSQISDIQVIGQKNKFLDEELIRSKNTMTIKENELNLHQKDENKPSDDLTFEEIESKKNSLLEEKKASEEQLSVIKTKLAMNKQKQYESDSCRKEYEKRADEHHLWEQLAKAIGTTDGDNFRDVAQAYTMGILLNRANYYMKQLSSRYQLYNSTDSLAIMVQDLEMGGELRAASSLSGGETFLVSLALALGLTSLNDEHFNTDMLFIDEGFGTLDPESLDMVMNTLENLHNLGRRVGIISPVDTLKERIPAQIQLIREGKSASKVRVVRN